jgi:tripartite-type tricarboxylate transporter receptor subunit TctC
MIAPYLEKYLGATVVVENVTGAGGNVGRARVWDAAPDGLTIGFTSGTAMVYSQLSESEGVKYDCAKVTWLARVLGEPSVMVVPKKGKYQSIEDMRKAASPVKFAVSGVGDDDFFAMGIEGKALGIKFLPVTGYKGTKEASLAVVAGEVDAFQTSVSSMLPLIRQGDVNPLAVIYDQPVPELPNVPAIMEFVKDDAAAAKLLKVPVDLSKINRVFFGPPGMPTERVQVLEEALNKALNDPDLLASAKKADRPISYMPGSEVSRLVQGAMAQAAEITPILKEILKSAE